MKAFSHASQGDGGSLTPGGFCGVGAIDKDVPLHSHHEQKPRLSYGHHQRWPRSGLESTGAPNESDMPNSDELESPGGACAS